MQLARDVRKRTRHAPQLDDLVIDLRARTWCGSLPRTRLSRSDWHFDSSQAAKWASNRSREETSCCSDDCAARADRCRRILQGPSSTRTLVGRGPTKSVNAAGLPGALSEMQQGEGQGGERLPLLPADAGRRRAELIARARA